MGKENDIVGEMVARRTQLLYNLSSFGKRAKVSVRPMPELRNWLVLLPFNYPLLHRVANFPYSHNHSHPFYIGRF